MRETIHSHQKALQNWVPKARSATTYNAESPDDAVIDTKGFSEALVVLNLGAIPSNGTIIATIEESDSSDLSSPAAITGASFGTLSSSVDATGYMKVGHLKLAGRKRYLSANLVIANQTIPCSVTFVLGATDVMPVGVTPVFDV